MDLKHLNLPPGLLEENATLGTFCQTVSLASQLLDSFQPRTKLHGHGNRQDSILRQNLSWILNGHQRLRTIILRWLRKAGSNLPQEEEQISVQYLEHVHRFCIVEPISSGPLSGRSLVNTWSQCLAEFLAIDSLKQLPTLQTGLSYFLNDLSEAMRKSESVVRQLQESLMPVLSEILNRNTVLQSLDSGLKVSSSLSLAMFRPLLTSPASELNSQSSRRFDNPARYHALNRQIIRRWHC